MSECDMPDRLWVRRDLVTPILGPFEVSSVADPEGLAAIESGWHEYVLVDSKAENERLRAALERIVGLTEVEWTTTAVASSVRNIAAAALGDEHQASASDDKEQH